MQNQNNKIITKQNDNLSDKFISVHVHMYMMN